MVKVGDSVTYAEAKDDTYVGKVVKETVGSFDTFYTVNWENSKVSWSYYASDLRVIPSNVLKEKLERSIDLVTDYGEEGYKAGVADTIKRIKDVLEEYDASR